MTTDFAIALIEAYIEEADSRVITTRRLAVNIGNVLIDLVKAGTAWDNRIADAFELAAEACYMIAPTDDESQEWLYQVSDRYEDLRP